MAAGGRCLSCLLAVLSALLTPGYGGYRQIGTMAGVGWLSPCLLAALSVFVTTGQCSFLPIDLQSSGVRCNMSSIYKDTRYGESMNCTGAINNNTDTVWKNISDSNPNCVYTVNGVNEYWLLDLGQPYNIHRITTYLDAGIIGYMRNRRVLLDGIQVFQFLDAITNPEQTTGGKLPARGQIIKITGATGYIALCEFQVDECTTDSYGVDCVETCSSGCRANGDSTTCDSISGNCTQGCEREWWGGRCNLSCSSRCAVQCGRDTGDCAECRDNFAPPDCQGCKAGFHGSACDEPCSNNCLPDNNGTVTCGQDDGRCTTGCAFGYFGLPCDSLCSMGCVNGICNRQDGACSCLIGWTSSDCTECDLGYFGMESCEKCGYCRDGDVCDNDNGHCPNGCDEGFGRERCDQCTGGRWSSDCSLPCGQCAGDGSCYALTGFCVHGCVQGFEGDNCTLKTASGGADTQDGGNFTGPLVGGLLGAGALIGLSILLTAFINRRRRARDTSNSTDTDGARVMSGDAPIRDVTEGDKPETETPGSESDYAQLEKYEDPDDIRPYSMLQDGGKLPKYLKIQRDQERVLYQNTTLSTASNN